MKKSIKKTAKTLIVACGIACGVTLLGGLPAEAASRWWGGAGVGLSFGGQVDFVSIEPYVSYSISEKWVAGSRVVFRWASDERYGQDIETSDFGVALFSRYFFTKNFFAHGEYEWLDYEYATGPSTTDRDGFGSLFVGGGYNQPLSRNSAFFVLGLYNLTYEDDERSPYDDPWVLRAGLGFRF